MDSDEKRGKHGEKMREENIWSDYEDRSVENENKNELEQLYGESDILGGGVKRQE